ncbi:MAG: OAM dimerization domain-containing protein [Thermodesulfobacteriota bacterium]|nr:OAM dimerization domain-containing protein [Thermodesulfobacteriota bacterium]
MIRPYGDTLNDGRVQLSFTLPIEKGERAIKAAELYVRELNLTDVTVAHAKKIGDHFTFFVVFATAKPALDYSTIRASEVKTKQMDYYEINELIRTELARKISVVGATIGSDAHTVGIDAIMSMKGYNRDYGLERYPEINTYNMGAQVSCKTLLEKALAVSADAILVSQTVTQKDVHVANFTEFAELLKAKNVRDRVLLLAGGPRMTNDFAVQLGYDVGFGPGTLPSHVASFIVTRLLEKKGADSRS